MKKAPTAVAHVLTQACIFGIILLSLNGCGTNALSDLNGTLLEPAMDIADYGFNSADGDFNVSDFQGKHLVLAFGYTYCPDACPTTMARLNQTIKLIEEDADQVQVLLITVDPLRDSLSKLKTYTKTFHPDFIGASVATADSAALFKTLGIYHERARTSTTDSVREEGLAEDNATDDYLVDHTTSTIVLDPDGNWRMVWNFELKPEEMAADLKKLIRAQ